MDNEEFKENMQAAQQILKNIQIPGKGDSMLLAAKGNHVERIGILLNDLLIKSTDLAQIEVDDIVQNFKNVYRETFLKFIEE